MRIMESRVWTALEHLEGAADIVIVTTFLIYLYSPYTAFSGNFQNCYFSNITDILTPVCIYLSSADK